MSSAQPSSYITPTASDLSWGDSLAWTTTKTVSEDGGRDDNGEQEDDEIILSSILNQTSLAEKSSSSSATVSDSPLKSGLDLPVFVSPFKQERFSEDKILIVLDLNGLLFERVFKGEMKKTDPKPDAKLGNHLVWARPHSQSFLSFVFSEFIVGVWSSAREENVKLMVDSAFSPEQRSQLKFMFHQGHCTNVGKHPTNPNKPLLQKELKKIWQKYPDLTQRTLLIDDSPEKVTCNPPFTAIHPKEWNRMLVEDSQLSASGPVRIYLEKLALAAAKTRPFRLRDYIRDHPLYAESDTDVD